MIAVRLPLYTSCSVEWLIAWLLLVAAPWPVYAQSAQAIPALTSHVVDETGTLSPEQRQALDHKLSAFEAASGAQLVVLMVRSTAPEDIASYANRAASTWKIGRKEVGDGVLLLIAKDDRALRIEVARALEGAIPDLLAKRIIDHAITPRFKLNDFAGGMDAGTEQLITAIRGEALPIPDAATSPNDFQGMDFIVFLFFTVAVGGSTARRVLGTRRGSAVTALLAAGLAYYVTHSLLWASGAGVAAFVLTLLTSLNKYHPALSANAGSGAGYGGSGTYAGGGGFRSGGGGSFGGGGASGGW